MESRRAGNQLAAHGGGSRASPSAMQYFGESPVCADRAQSPLVYFRETRHTACYKNVRRRVAAESFFDGRRMRSPARRLAVSVVASAVDIASLASSADAKPRHKHSGGSLSSFLHFTSQPKYASIVVDAKTGEVLYEQNADAHRYPASITKIMTMYLTFEALADHRLSFDDRVVVSPHAASVIPDKVGLRPGQSLSVREAMNAIAVLSANDMAV